MSVETKCICRLPRFRAVAGERETNGSIGGRSTAFVAALLLGISGILALCKVGSFSNLGPGFGWTAIGLSVGLLSGSGLVKRIERQSDENPDGSLEGHSAATRQRKADVELASSKSERVKMVFQERDSFELQCTGRFRDVYLTGDQVVTHTDKETSLRAADTGNYTAQLVDPSGLLQLTELIKEGNRIAYFGYKSITVAPLDRRSQSGIGVRDVIKLNQTIKPDRMAMKGDFLVESVGSKITLWSISTQQKVQEIEATGKVIALSIYANALVYVDQGSRTIKRVPLQAEGAPLSDCPITGERVCLIDEKRFVQTTSRETLLCSLETGETILKISAKAADKWIVHNDFIISYCSQMDQNPDETGYITPTYRTYVNVFSAKDGRKLQSFTSQDHWAATDMRMVGDDLVLCGRIGRPGLHDSTPGIWKLSLAPEAQW